jgi:two-component system, cell cycle response regulator
VAINATAKHKPAKAKVAVPPSRKLNILVVDDEVDARDLLADFLKLEGHAVTTSVSAAEALEILENGQFDLLMSDLIMPKIDGIALTVAVKEMGRMVPVIVMTAFGTIEYAVESMKAGAFDFITKPYNFEHIRIIIAKLIAAQEYENLLREREYYRNLSNIDGLTELSNHRHFKFFLEKEIARERRYHRPLTLMMIDIDDFKRVNDSYGHLVGDIVLKNLATLLKQVVRGCDFVARYGGEEFVVVLPETPQREAELVGNRILAATRKADLSASPNHVVCPVTITIGLATFPKHAKTMDELIEKADLALYQGKNAGKNKISVFHESQG